jgi:hypothetical protein
LADAAGTRLQRAMQRQQMAQQQAQHEADFGLRRQELGQRAAQQAADLAFRQQQLDQENWAATPDASGGIVMYNRKTGEMKALGPQGPGVGGFPGKAKDLWADVQQYGKVVEPLAKAEPDIQTLRDAARRGEVAGFGPVQGRVPDLLASAEGVGNRQAAGRLMAAIIQATSGQAASEKEVARLLKANGLGPTATDTQIGIGIEKLAAQYDNLLRQRQASFHPAVVQAFEGRGGYAGAGAPSAVLPRKNVGGKTYEKRPDGWYEVQ